MAAPLPEGAVHRFANDRACMLSTGTAMTESLPKRGARYLVNAGTSILSESNTTTEHMTSSAARRLVAVVVRRDLECTLVQLKVRLMPFGRGRFAVSFPAH